MKYFCTNPTCNWHGTGTKLPFACPQCTDRESVAVACDEPGCWKESTRGTLTIQGYRITCGKHIPTAHLPDE